MIKRNAASLPAIVQVTANTHIALLNRLLPGWLTGWNAVGSAALGCFDRRVSDLDFVAVVQSTPDRACMKALQKAHRQLNNRRLFAPLDGWYVPEGALAGEALPCLRFNDGKLWEAEAFPIHGVDGWVLKHHGVALLGPGSEELPFDPDWALVRQAMAENLKSYWKAWADRRRTPLSIMGLGLMLSPEALEWGVLGVSRILYSLREGGITGKEAAGRYALATVPERFHPVIHEALRRRDRAMPQQIPQPLLRYRAALEYIDYIIGAYGSEPAD